MRTSSIGVDRPAKRHALHAVEDGLGLYLDELALCTHGKMAAPVLLNVSRTYVRVKGKKLARGFGVYDPVAHAWRDRLKNALLGR